jgi:hypothetical protein
VQTKPINLRIDFPNFGSVAPPREGLAWKACAGTRPNENTLILLAPAAQRKGHRHELLHRRTWLLELLCYLAAGNGDGFSTITAGLAKKLRAGETDSYYAYASDILSGS